MDAVAGVLDEHPEFEDELRKAIPNLTDQDLLEARYGKDGHGPVKVEGTEHLAATRTAGLDQHWLFCSDLPRAAFHFVMKTSPDGRAAYYNTSSENRWPHGASIHIFLHQRLWDNAEQQSVIARERVIYKSPESDNALCLSYGPETSPTGAW